MTRASEWICDVLIEAGIDHVFGIPGGGTVPIWDALFERQDRIKVVLARHEGAAACMADMYGRITRKPAVLMGQGAFIATNGGFGILEAYLSNSPMLVLTDTSDGGLSQHGNYQSGTGEYGSYDIVAMMRAMSKFTSYAVTPVEAVQGVQLAAKHARLGRPGPACVVMRNIAAAGEIEPAQAARIHSSPGYLSSPYSTVPSEYIDNASHLLVEAHRPVIIAGNGVHISRAYGELRELAELLAIPVATSYTGKSTFPETHSLALGMMGTFGQSAANRAIAEADVILVAGCRLSPSDTRYESPALIDPSRQKIIQIDIDPRNTGWTFPVVLGLVGDLKIVLGQLLDMVRRQEGARAAHTEERLGSIEVIKKEEHFFEAEELYSDVSPLLPQRIVREVEKAIGASTIITLDAGNNRLWMSHFFKSQEAGTVFCPGGIAGMGWGPAAALTAKLVHPERDVLSVSSDGGFAMMTHVLLTARHYQLPVAFLVMNNSGLGMVRDGQRGRGRVIASEFVETDFAAVAQSFGCLGINVRQGDELGPAIREALQASLPTVIDVSTSLTESHLKITT